MKIPESPTNWSLYDVPTIAAMLDDDYDAAWDQVMAWRYAYETISEHRKLLSSARAQLAAGWPPEQSIASARYFETVDGLDRSLVDTSEAAIRNSNALADVLTALSQAKASVDWLHESWKVNATSQVAPGQVHVPLGTAINAALMRDLNAQAHEIMTKTDQTIFDNTRQLISPASYQISTTNYKLTHLKSQEGGSTNGTGGGAESTGLTKLSESSEGESTTSKQHMEQQIGLTVGQQPSSGTATSDLDRTVADALSVGAGGAIAGSTAWNWISRNGSTVKNAPSKAVSNNDLQTPLVNPSSPKSTLESQPEPAGLLSPGMGAPPRSPATGRRRRRRGAEDWAMPKGVPSLIVPRAEEPIYHDPGPGVIGMTR